MQILRTNVMTLSQEDYGQKLDQYYYPAFDSVATILENYLVNFILSKNFFFHPPYLAYYHLAFSYAVSIALALGYCIETDQPINQQFMLQAICAVENLFYPEWFYRHGTALQDNYGDARLLENSLALVHI